MAQLANGKNAGHARATFQGVQVALQINNQTHIRLVIAQVGEHTIGMIEDVA